MSTVSKQQLCNLYGISRETLRRLLNVVFFEELATVGYKKTCNLLSPRVYNKFTELYGEPLPTQN